MQIFSHAGIGWLLAETGRGDRRFRQVVFAAAMLPDVDAVSIVFGLGAYGTYHDRLTHAVPFSLLVSLAGMALVRGHRAKALLFTQLAFWSHILGDFLFSGWPIALWFPFSRAEILLDHALWLGHPVNHLLSLLGVAYMLGTGRTRDRTAFEAFNVTLDRRICNLLFRDKTLNCATCGRPANETCSVCGHPICPRHARLGRQFSFRCAACRHSPPVAARARTGTDSV